MQVNVVLNPTISKDYVIYIDELKKLVFDTKVMVVTNTTIADLHLEAFLTRINAKELHAVILPDGEMYKNFESITQILNACFEHRLDRKSLLIALGGGVIGDMTGFAASIYQRGIAFVQVPTTLLAQVDASVGGKTGINNSYGKNLIGSFWQPKAVYCESAFLQTLPAREFSAGVAEIIKMAVTFDADFFAWLETHDLHDTKNLKIAIQKSVALKANVVSQDETEQGIRAVLNYGHTFAHVIENQTHYSTYLHGEAVAIGIVMANTLAQKLGLMHQNDVQRVQAFLLQYHLPITYAIPSPEAFYEAFFLDKKSANAKIKFILAKGIGGFEMRNDLSKETVLDVLGTFHA